MNTFTMKRTLVKPANWAMLASVIATTGYAGTLLQFDFNETTWPVTPQKPNIEGINDLMADPLFIKPSADPAVADFRLQPGSPALKAGRWETFSPIVDLEDKPRLHNGVLDLGAFQK